MKPVDGNAIEARLARLETLSLAELRQAWYEHYRQPPPRTASRKLLTRAVGYRLQEAAFGGLKPETRRRLARLVP
jgi:hypothetical protein